MCLLQIFIKHTDAELESNTENFHNYPAMETESFNSNFKEICPKKETDKMYLKFERISYFCGKMVQWYLSNIWLYKQTQISLVVELVT